MQHPDVTQQRAAIILRDGLRTTTTTPETQKDKKIFTPDNLSIQVDLVFPAFLFRPAKHMIKKKRVNY